MAKTSHIIKNKKRELWANKYRAKRKELREVIKGPKYSLEDKEAARKKLNSLPRLSLESRVRNRCEITGRSRGYYRKFKMSRLALRELANLGLIPGVIKSSW
jgi:small subunit ribosomal protein S14